MSLLFKLEEFKIKWDLFWAFHWRAAFKACGLFFVVQFINYANLCWNFRAIAQAQYLSIAITDGIASYIGFKLVKKIGEAESRAALIGYMAGGMVGSLVSTYVSKKVFGA